MLGDGELLAIGVTAALWLAAFVAAAFRRRRVAVTFTLIAGAATIATIAWLRQGIGHRG